MSNLTYMVIVQHPLPLTPSRQGRGDLIMRSSLVKRHSFVPSPLTGEGQGGGELLPYMLFSVKTQQAEIPLKYKVFLILFLVHKGMPQAQQLSFST